MPGDEDQLREVVHDDVDPDYLLRRELQPRARDAGAAEDRDAQVHAGLVDRVHLRIVDRHLREGPRREAPTALMPNSSYSRRIVRTVPLTSFGSAMLPVGDEPVGMPLRAPACDVCVGDADHADLDAEPVHLAQRDRDRVGGGQVLRARS